MSERANNTNQSDKVHIGLSRLLEAAGLLMLPIAMSCAVVGGIDQGGAVGIFAAFGSIVLFFLSYEWGHPTLRETMPVVVMAALGAAGRIVFAPVPGVQNAWSMIAFYHPQTFAQVLALWAPALPYDIAHAVSTVAFLALLWAPWHRKLERLQDQYGLGDRSKATGRSGK